MPYPATIDSVNLPPLSNSTGWNQGPFINGTNLYVITASGIVGNKLTAYKSTDNGNTWAVVNLAGSPNFNVGGFLSCVLVGTKIFTAVVSVANAKLAFLDMSTDLWTTVTTAGAYGFPNATGAILTYNETTARGCNLVSRSDGSFVVPYIGTEVVGGPTFCRTRFDVWTGAAWSVADSICGESGLANNDFCVGVVGGSGDRTHVFYVEYATKTVRLRTIKSDNSVTAAAQVIATIFDPGGANTQSLAESVGRPAFNPATGEIALPYKDAAGHLNVATATSGDAPIWALTLVDNTKIVMEGAAGNAGAQVSVAFYTSVGLNILFIDSTFVNFFVVSRTGAVWGAPKLLTTNTAVGFFQFQTIGTNDTADNTTRFLMVEVTGGSAAYFQAAGSSPALGPANILALDQQSIGGGGVIALPYVRSCCKLCEQPQRTGLPHPIQASKGLTYARS